MHRPSLVYLSLFLFVLARADGDEGTCSKVDGANCRDESKEKQQASSTLKINANKHGNLHLAVRSGNFDAVRDLLSTPDKASLLKAYDGSQWGHTALHLAVGSGQVKMLEILLEAGPDVNAKNKADEVPLTIAAASGQTRAVELLIKHGADLEKTGAYGRTALHQAALGGHVAVVELLLSKGADITAKDSERASNALHLAASFGQDAVVKALLSAKPDLIHVVNALGHTPLHCACWQARPSTVKLLLERGANPKAVDRNGDTAYGLAYNSGKKDIVDLLKKLGVRS